MAHEVICTQSLVSLVQLLLSLLQRVLSTSLTEMPEQPLNCSERQRVPLFFCSALFCHVRALTHRQHLNSLPLSRLPLCSPFAGGAKLTDVDSERKGIHGDCTQSGEECE